MTGAAVRRAGRDDLDAVLALWMALTEHHARIDPLFALRPDAASRARGIALAQLRDPDTAVFVHADAGSLDGLCVVRVDRAPPIHEEVTRAEITDLYVAPLRRRSGLGGALLAAAIDWVRARGIRRIEARVSSHNREGQAFWRSAGFGDFVDVLQRRL